MQLLSHEHVFRSWLNDEGKEIHSKSGKIHIEVKKFGNREIRILYYGDQGLQFDHSVRNKVLELLIINSKNDRIVMSRNLLGGYGGFYRGPYVPHEGYY